MDLAEQGTPGAILRQLRQDRGWSLQETVNRLSRVYEQETGKVCGLTVSMLGKWERDEHLPSPMYRKLFCLLYQRSATALGFLLPPRDYTSQKQLAPGLATVSQEPSETQKEQNRVKDLEQESLSLFPSQAEKYATIDPRRNEYPSVFSAFLTGQRLDDEDMEQSRRDLLQRIFGVTGALYVQPHQELLQFETWERLAHALAKPSRVDVVTLDHLEKLTENCWQLLPGVAQIVSDDLLSTVLGHLRRITSLLEGYLPEETHRRLCSLANQLAQIAGDMFFHINDYPAAQAYYRVALEAAQQARNPALAAVCLGRMGFLPFYSGNATASLPLLQEARRLASLEVSPTIRAWLAAVEAEAQANAQEAYACLKALEGTKLSYDIQDDPYRTGFDAAKFAGYHGVCHLRLHQPAKAQNCLQQGLDKLDPSAIYQRSILLTDFADTSIALSEIEAMGIYASEALKIVQRTRSPHAFQRICKLQEDLKSWQTHPIVKDLEEQIRITKASLLSDLARLSNERA